MRRVLLSSSSSSSLYSLAAFSSSSNISSNNNSTTRNTPNSNTVHYCISRRGFTSGPTHRLHQSEGNFTKRVRDVINSLINHKKEDTSYITKQELIVRDKAPEMNELLAYNKEWAAAVQAVDPNYFATLAKQQRPNYFWIGCSDSRVPANQILGLAPGEVFVHRNIANICSRGDLNMLSTLQYAVQTLRTENVIVCGHYRCGGVMAAFAEAERDLEEENVYAALVEARHGTTEGAKEAFYKQVAKSDKGIVNFDIEPVCTCPECPKQVAKKEPRAAMVPATPTGTLVDTWIMHIVDIKRQYDSALKEIAPQYRQDALCEINVIVQARNVAESTVTQGWWHAYRQQECSEQLKAKDGELISIKDSNADVTRFHSLSINGWIYDVADGLIRPPLITITAGDSIETVFKEALFNIVARYKQKKSEEDKRIKESRRSSS